MVLLNNYGLSNLLFQLGYSLYATIKNLLTCDTVNVIYLKGYFSRSWVHIPVPAKIFSSEITNKAYLLNYLVVEKVIILRNCVATKGLMELL